MKEQYGFDMSLGTVFNKEKIVANALETVVSDILERIRGMSVIHMDETGHYCNGKKEWMWEASSADSAYFTILKSRGKKAMKSFMGSYASTVVSDRYAVYNHFEYRQLCWAHLKRDFRRLSEKEDKRVSRIGCDLLNETKALFEVWHRFKAGKISRELLGNEVKPIRNKIGELLEEASYTPVHLKAARFADNLLDEFNSLWRFIYAEGVEPTNNHAERCLRRSVIWRKKYFGTRSESGSQFVSRTASVIATCRLQARSAYDYLTLAIESYFFKTAPPQLLPLT
jgi:transposase